MLNNNTQALAEKIYNSLLDMDFFDYADTVTEDLQTIEKDLELLQKHGAGALLKALEMLTENY